MGRDLNKAVSHALDQSSDPEGEAHSLFSYLRERFGWSGTIFMRADLGEITDEQWDEARYSRTWNDLPDYLSQKGNEYLEDTLFVERDENEELVYRGDED